MRLARLVPVLVVCLAGVQGRSLANPQAANASPLSPDEQALTAAHLTTTGSALLDFFRKRAATDASPEQLTDFIQKLADKSSLVHQTAFAELVSLGAAAVPRLRQAANDLDDLDAAARARHCLQFTEGAGSVNLLTSAARLVALRKPAGAAEVLLAYLPFADDSSVVKEVEEALTVVAVRDGKAEPAVVQALQDPIPIRRAIAAEILCRAGGVEQHRRVRPLLKDPKPTVRLRAALGLAKNHDAEAIPVLIDLLADLPPLSLKQAEEYLASLAGEWTVILPSGDSAVPRRLRRDVWAAWWKTTEGAALLDELRRRTLSDADRERVLGLIQQLGDQDVKVRERASAALVAMGPAPAPLLHQAIQADNSQASLYAANCLKLIEKDRPSTLPGVIARLIALRKPPGAAEALLRYLPFVERGTMLEEVKNALAAVAIHDGQVDAVLLAALHDPVDLRRAAAAEILVRSGSNAHRDAVRLLLADSNSTVRLRTALTLAGSGDKQAVPTLIALIGELPAEQTWQVEEYLFLLAGDKLPSGTSGSDALSRGKVRDAWAAWWRQHGDAVDQAALDPTHRTMGFTLVLEAFDHNRKASRVLEFDPSGKVRWKLDNLPMVLDAHVVSGDRVLLAEQTTNRVVERDLKGNILWQVPAVNVFACERLRNGHTFIAGRQYFAEVDRQGKEIFRYDRPVDNIASAQRLTDGQIAFVTYQGQYVRLDTAGKEVKNVRVPFVLNQAHNVSVLPNDHLLVGLSNNNKVAEYNLEGKVLWEANVPAPGPAMRLRNGNTLVASMGSMCVLELARTGKTVRELKETNLRPWRVYRR